MKINDIFNEVKILTPKEIESFIENKPIESYTILDVRQPSEYESSHIPGAILIPLPELPNRYTELYAELPTIVYCRSGKRSYSAASFLKGIGFEQVYSMDGGMLAWQGLQAEGSYDIELNKVAEDIDFLELSAMSWAMEDGTGKFYNEIAGMVVKQELKKLFNDLAFAEHKHKDNILRAVEAMDKNGSKIRELVDLKFKDLMEGGVGLQETLNKIKLAQPLDLSLLEFSMQIEINSLDLYLKIFHNIDNNEEARELINSIIEEEKIHLKRIGDVLEGLNI